MKPAKQTTVEIPARAKITHQGLQEFSGTSKNIAIGGILFKNKEPLSIDAQVQVSISINKDSDPLLLIGTIVRVEVLGQDNYDIGMTLSFKEMEKIAKDEISKFLIQQSQYLDYSIYCKFSFLSLQ